MMECLSPFPLPYFLVPFSPWHPDRHSFLSNVLLKHPKEEVGESEEQADNSVSSVESSNVVMYLFENVRLCVCACVCVCVCVCV